MHGGLSVRISLFRRMSTTTSLTNQHVHKTMPETIFSYNEKQSFGLVNCDPTRQPPIATYQVVNIEGQVVETLELSLDQLRFYSHHLRWNRCAYGWKRQLDEER